MKAGGNGIILLRDHFTVTGCGLVGIYHQFHAGKNIFHPHESADAKLTPQRFYHGFNRIDIACGFVVFTEHSVADLIRVGNGSCHMFNNAGYLFKIIYKVEVRCFHFFHCSVNHMNIVF